MSLDLIILLQSRKRIRFSLYKIQINLRDLYWLKGLENLKWI